VSRDEFKDPLLIAGHARIGAWPRGQRPSRCRPAEDRYDYRALNLVEVLAAIRRSGRQVIIAVEDAALADLLCRRLRSSVGEIGRRFELQTPKRSSQRAEAADWESLIAHIARLGDRYARELVNNAYAVLNVITEFASHRPSIVTSIASATVYNAWPEAGLAISHSNAASRGSV
jgi:hypothetical protein